MLSNIRIGNKLLLILSVNIVLLIVIGSVAAISSQSISQRLQQIFNRDLRGTVFLLEADRDLHQAFIAERTMIFATPGTKAYEGQMGDYTSNKGQADTRMDKFAAIASTQEQRDLVKQYKSDRVLWDEVSLKILKDKAAGVSIDELSELSLGEGQKRFDTMRENINTLTEALEKQAVQAEEEAMSSYESLLVIIVVLTVASALVGAGSTLLVTRNITVPIRKLMEFTACLTSGECPEELNFKRRDEIGSLAASFDNMNRTLQHNIEEIAAKSREAEEKADAAENAMREAEAAKEEALTAKRDGMLQAAGQLEDIVSQIASASEELNAQIQESRQGSEIQRERTAEAATAMEEMNATVLEVASNASNAAENADAARSRAEEGGDVVTKVVESIAMLNKETEQLHREMSDLGKQADAIGQIMTVISDIADQTNLLALNAAIEAARAGEAGRGFAVVADEVRKLAEKTMTATQEVGSAIASIQDSTKKSIRSMDQTATMVNNSTELTGKAGQSLTSIIEIIENTADQVRAIATAAEEQSATSEQINRGTEEINRISADTAEAMSQSALAMEDIARLSDKLRMLIDDMKQS